MRSTCAASAVMQTLHWKKKKKKSQKTKPSHGGGSWVQDRERKERDHIGQREKTSLLPEVSELSLMDGGQEFRHQRGAAERKAPSGCLKHLIRTVPEQIHGRFAGQIWLVGNLRPDQEHAEKTKSAFASKVSSALILINEFVNFQPFPSWFGLFSDQGKKKSSELESLQGTAQSSLQENWHRWIQKASDSNSASPFSDSKEKIMHRNTLCDRKGTNAAGFSTHKLRFQVAIYNFVVCQAS